MKKLIKKVLKSLIPNKIWRLLKTVWNLDKLLILSDNAPQLLDESKQALTNTQVLFQYIVGFSAVPGERRLATAYPDVIQESLYRYKAASQFVRPNDRVLDCSCGCGHGTAYLNDHTEASEIIGADINPKSVEFCSKLFGTSNFVWKETKHRFQVTDLTDASAFPEEHFDTIISLETIEHVPNPIAEKAFENIYRWLKSPMLHEREREAGEPLFLCLMRNFIPSLKLQNYFLATTSATTLLPS